MSAVGLCAFAVSLKADDKKEVTLKGTLLCAKCALKEADKCTNAIQVQEGGKTVTYYLHDKGQAEPYHAEICTDRKEATVTGVIHEHDGKKMIEPKKVEFTKK